MTSSIIVTGASAGLGEANTYFSGRRQRASSPESHDTARAAKLWQVSEELVTSAAG